MTEITREMKAEFLSIQSDEDYMRFIEKYKTPIVAIIQDEEMAQKVEELLRATPGSCGDGTGNHVELWKKNK